MAAKKSVRKQTATGRASRKSSTRKTASKTPAGRKPANKATARKKKAVSKPRPTRPKTTAAARRTAALGRPRVACTAELELMFQKDLEAREVFAFLRVKTLKELEELSADEILRRLTEPMDRTLGRIRKALAMNNRCLAGDQKFAVAFKKQVS